MTEYSALRIEKMPHGGFVVTDGRGDAGFITAALFASTSIGEAFAFIAGRLDPKPADVVVERPATRCTRCGSSGVRRYCSRCVSERGGSWMS